PAIWTHFQVPWSRWNGGQDTNATPASYALLVRQYVQAIHRVDPAAPIIGLGGVGTGAYGETSWISATVAENGPNLSAVAIHVYPAGTPPSGTATLAQFFSNATGAHSLAARVPADRAAIRSACLTCTTLALLVTEYGSASSFGSFSQYAFGFPQVPFVASEVIQGLDLNVSQMYLRQVETPHAGSWIDGSTGYLHPLYTLYSELLPMLGPIVVPTTVAPADPGVTTVATESVPNGSRTILVDNTNVSTSVTLQLDSTLEVAGPDIVWSWNQSSAAPVERNGIWNSSTEWTIPPVGILLIHTAAPSVNSSVLVHAGGTAPRVLPSTSTATPRGDPTAAVVRSDDAPAVPIGPAWARLGRD
ncbi:MAG: hypothetical protein L3J86_05145, partial [Thermoplasmata archaeon]|nr:hypothetical protein [Thermoplasmata archaeon]